MIIESSGSIFDSNAQVLVSPVDCTGVQGAGLALEFKKRFPLSCEWYKKECLDGQSSIGRCQFARNVYPLLCFFPTKRNYWEKSNLPDIRLGLVNLVSWCKQCSIESIAIPALGCGLGGLDWADVKLLIEEAFKDFKGTVYLFPPIEEVEA